MRGTTKQKTRSPWLTLKMERILRAIVEERDPAADCTENSLTHGRGRVWYVGTERVSHAAAIRLQQLCLLRRAEYSDQSIEYYWRSPEVEKVLADPSYVPEIVAHWMKQS